jgi:hypothetical protein
LLNISTRASIRGSSLRWNASVSASSCSVGR